MATPRDAVTDQQQYQQQRYESQQNPMYDAMAFNYGRGSEANFGDYTDIMNSYRNIAAGGGTVSPGGGSGGGDGSYGAESWAPELISYNDPFNSYAGYQDFSKTGGYSPADIANMRARGTAPVRAAYANAEREVGRQRSLQGGYSPNAFALQARMAREQGQLGADAMTNVEAGLAEARNTGRLKGLEGMTDVEKQRLAADLDVSKFNANAKMSAASSNAGARNAAAAGSAANALASSAASRADQFRALQGMTSLYGTNPGMAETFGNQLLSATGQSGTFGNNQVNATYNANQLPGKFEQTTSRIKDIGDLVGRGANVVAEYRDSRNNQPTTTQPIVGTNPGFGNVPSAPVPAPVQKKKPIAPTTQDWGMNNDG